MYPTEVSGVDPVVDDPGGPPADLGKPLRATNTECRLLVVGPPPLRTVAEQALTAAPVAVETTVAEPEALSVALQTAADVDSALVIVPPARPFARCPGPIHDGIPVGVLPAETAAGLETAIVTDRSAASRAILAMGTDEYLEPAAWLRTRLGDRSPAGIDVADWRANMVSRPGLCRRLAGGPTLAIYLGHGRPTGLSGYQALRWRHVAAVPQRRPIGLLVALACHTLAAGAPDRPFAERFVAAGRAGATLGAVRSVDATAVAALSHRLGDSLVRDDPATVGELLQCLSSRLEQAGCAELLKDFRLTGLPTRRLR